jgi:hypothetical protein
MAPICNTCNPPFEFATASEFKEHVREAHQATVRIRFRGETEQVEVARGDDGMFHCPCGHYPPNPNPVLLQRHAARHPRHAEYVPPCASPETC